MAKAIALSKAHFAALSAARIDIVHSAIVLGCSAALILAGQPLPI